MTPRIMRSEYLRVLSFSLLIVAVAIAGSECFLRFYQSAKRVPDQPKIKYVKTEPYQESSDLLGYGLKANFETSVKASFEGETIYDVTYNTDEFGRRVTPADETAQRSYFALFFGCSYTFGAGLQNDQTLPFYFGEYLPSFRSYNYAIEGHGPQAMLAILENRDIASEVREKKGIAVYVYADSHIRRAIGSMSVSLNWGKRLPYYEVQGEKLVRKETFATGRPILSKMYNFIGGLALAKYFNVKIPRISNSHIRYTSRMIGQAKDEFYRHFPEGQFYVLFYPLELRDPRVRRVKEERYAKMMAYLESLGVDYLDYTNLIPISDPKYRIPVDGHPSREANKLLARKLADDLSVFKG